MNHLSVEQVKELHAESLTRYGGLPGVRDEGMIESAVAQTSGAFAGVDYYPSLEEKAAALAFSLVCNHPFNDGNKRTGLLALELFLNLNGYGIVADTEENVEAFLALAAGEFNRDEFTDWVRSRMVPAIFGDS